MGNIKSIGGNPIVLGLDGLKDEVKAGLNTPADTPALAVGSAAALLGDPETASWMERTTAADGAVLIDAVYGNTLRWNQLADNGNFASGTTHWAGRESTLTVSDGVATVVPNSAGTSKGLTASSTMGICVLGHKYLISTEFSTNETTNLGLSFAGADQAIVTVPSVNTWYTCRAIWTNTNSETRILPYLLATASLTTSAQLKYRNVQIFDLTQMFGAGNEPSTVAEFEALYPEPYYPYDAGSLLPVRMEGVETVGKNLFDVPDVTTSGATYINSNGVVANRTLSTVGPLAPGTYTLSLRSSTAANDSFVITICNDDESYRFQNSQRALIQGQNVYSITLGQTCTKFILYTSIATSLSNIQLETGSTATAYAPYWSSQLAIPVSTYFPDGMRSAGSVYDELTNTEAIHRVGAGTVTSHGDVATGAQNKYAPLNGVNADQYSSYDAMPAGAGWVWSDKLGRTTGLMGSSQLAIGRTWNSIYAYAPLDADDSIFDQLVGATVWYQLANPTTTPIDPPLPMSYRTGAGGTERVMVASGTQSAPPVFATRYPLDPADLAASIAPRESAVAEANHAVGDLIMLGWTLCKVTTAIARGEAITIGTNVTRTSVAAELAALS